MTVSERPQVRPEVLDVLARLRSRIRRYVALEGSALVLVVLGVAFWISLGADYWLELSPGVRRLFLFAAIVATGIALFRSLLVRLGRKLDYRSLALVLERRFPGLNDRLITTVELAGADRDRPELTRAM